MWEDISSDQRDLPSREICSPWELLYLLSPEKFKGEDEVKN